MDTVKAAVQECRVTRDMNSAACRVAFEDFPEINDPETLNRESLEEFEILLRSRIQARTGTACSIADWLGTVAESFEGTNKATIIERHLTQQRGSCLIEQEAQRRAHRLAALKTGPCTKERARAELEDEGSADTRWALANDPVSAAAQIDEAFATCVAERIAQCQDALDRENVQTAIGCWERNGWPEAPASTSAATLEAASACLRDVAHEEEAVRSCATGSVPSHLDAMSAADCPSEGEDARCEGIRVLARAACLESHAAMVFECAPLDLVPHRKAFLESIDFERALAEAVANARPIRCSFLTEGIDLAVKARDYDLGMSLLNGIDRTCTSKVEKAAIKKRRGAVEKLKKQLAAEAKENKRCGGRSLALLLSNIKWGKDVRKARGCKYDVFMKVINSDNGVILVSDVGGGAAVAVFRSRETFVDGSFINGRVAVLKGTTRVLLTDGARHTLPLFTLLP